MGIAVALITTVFAGAAFLHAPAAEAQFSPYVMDLLAAQQRTQKSLWDKIKDIADKVAKQAEKVWKTTGDVAYKNALRVFLGKIAQDTATWVASAGTGQKPLFITDGNYFKDLGNAAAGDFLDTLAKEGYGFSLCDPGTYKLQLDIAVRTKLNPNFCEESCQKNYDTQKETSTLVGYPPASFSTTYANAVQWRSEIQQIIATNGAWTGITQAGYGCMSPMTPTECVAAYDRVIAEAEQFFTTNRTKCLQACKQTDGSGGTLGQPRQSSCTLSKIKENVQGTTLNVGLSVSSGGYCSNNRGLSCTKNADCGSGTCLAKTYSTSTDALQKAFEDGDLPKIFDPAQNPLGQFLSITERAQQAANEKEELEKNLISFGASLPLRSLISGKVKTPSSITTSAAQEGLSTQNAAEGETKQTGSPVADAFGIFTKTLTSKLIERIFSKGIVDDKGTPGSLATSGTIGTVTGGVQAARDRFASLSQVDLGVGGNLDTLTELSSCPADVAVSSQNSVSAATANNCVMDASLRQAVEERLTVKEALERGLISDQKVFGFDANGREPDYRNGYPYRSLKILRKYRIIPVGWELAAEYIRDFEKQNVNIRTIIQQFDNASSPYYRLIDPSWVLKAPENICLRTGFTEQVVADEYVDDDGDEGGRKNIDYSKRYCNSDADANVTKECTCDDPNLTDDKSVAACESIYRTDTPIPKDKCSDGTQATSRPKATCAYITPRVRQVQRQEACVDERTCILENDDGTCKQYGTCTQEKDIWRFNGQSCNAQFASCQTFTNAVGQQVSYVQNSLQKSLCGEDNAGCQQYCTAKDFGTGQWSCTATSANTRRYDNDLQSCDPSAEGCTQLIRFASGTNILRNGSFEESTVVNVAGNVNFTGWRAGNNSQECGTQTFAASDAVSGTQSARVQWAPSCGGDEAHYFTMGVETGLPVGGKAFTVSFYAKTEGTACTPVAQIATGSGANAQYSPTASITLSPEWQRFSYTYTWPELKPDGTPRDETNFVTFFRSTQDCSYLVDAVQVDEGSQLTDYKDYGAANLAHLKLPPAQAGYNLGCTGNPTTDPPACANFALKCTADDMGCDLFTPLNGGQSIPAKPGQTCPADKVGCASFREQPTDGMLSRVAERTGYYCQNELGDPNFKFVSCIDDAQCGGNAGQNVICQPLVSFIGNTGGSCTAQEVGCEAYTNLDEVAKGGEGKAQFTRLQLCVPPDYTGNLANYYSWVGDNESGYQLKQYRLVRSNLDAAPCTNLETNLPLGCVDGTPGHPVASCTAADLAINPDCAQYYDDGGNIFYRLRSRVIHQTESCHPFRNTIDTLTYYADSGLSTSCSEAAVGCREYVGNTGNNTRVVLSSDFERGTYEPWTLANAANPSSESVNYGGHSLDVSGTPAAQADLNGALEQGKSYTIQFWAKARGAASVNVDVSLQATGSVALGTATVSPEWNVYTLGPGTVNFSTAGNNNLIFIGSSDFFIDNVTLTELTDNVYRIKGSQTACGGFEGCQAYRNRNGEVANYQSFEKLCQADRVGCERVINTQNSTSPFSRTLDMANLRGDVDGSGTIDRLDIDYLIAYVSTGGPRPFVFESGDIDADGGIDIADVTALVQYVEQGETNAIVNRVYPNDSGITPADTIEYWVNDPAKSCQAEDKGCRALGKQALGMAKVGGDFQKSLLATDTVYARDNPDAYPSILCGKEALFCDAFTTSSGGTSYFRDPSNRTCSYREPSAGNSGGWYVDGSNEPCPTIAPKGIPPEVPNGGFAGNCPAEQNGCGMFLDPLGTGESLTTNNDLEVGAAVPQGWAYCSNNPIQTCTQNSDCGAGNTCSAGASMLEYTDHDGTKAARLAITGVSLFHQNVVLQANTFYVVSAEVQRGNQAGNLTTEDARLGVANCQDASGNGVSVPSPDVLVTTDPQDVHVDIPADNFDAASWRRVSMRFFSGDAVTCQIFAGAEGGTNGHWFDKLQVRTTTNTSVLRQSVDSTSCNGQVGDKAGCRLFNDVSNTSLTFDVDTSPVGGSPVDVDSVGAPATCGASGVLCDSNTLLKVRRDRVCSQWISPTTTIESTKPSGEKENLSVGLATCDSFSPSGQCNHFVDEMRCSNNPKQVCITNSDCGAGGICKLFTVTGDAPTPTPAYTREDLRNKSGLTLAGMSWPDGTVDGKYPFGSALQIGADGVAVSDDILNGTFSKSSTILNSGWSLNNPDASRTRGNIMYNTDSTQLQLITEETLDATGTKAPIKADARLTVVPSSTGTSQTVLRTETSTLANRLTPQRTYMLAFDVRYLSQPDRALEEPQTLLTAGISSQNSVLPDYTWQGTVKPTTQWQRFVVGPLRLDAAATRAEGNSSTASHLGYDRGTGFVFFLTNAVNRTPFAIDNVSLLPTLSVADPASSTGTGITGQLNGEAFVARACRAYPNASALSCSYQDDTGKLYQGWTGYCLERDPKNPSTCLMWYPVDLLAGERNIFGRIEAAGYQERTPLYICMQNRGNWSTATFDGGHSECSNPYPGGLCGQTLGHRRSLNTRIVGLNLTGDDCNGDYIEDACSSGVRGICGCTIEFGAYDGHAIYRGTQVVDAADRYHVSEIDRVEFVLERSGASDWPLGSKVTVSAANDWHGSWPTNLSAGINYLDVRVNFDDDPLSANYQRIESLTVDFTDGSPGGGGAYWAGYVVLKEYCTQVAQVVAPGQNAAWSTTVQNPGYTLPNYRYKLTQEARPYGTIVQPETYFDVPELWDGDSRRVSNQEVNGPISTEFTTSTARSGSAYACPAGRDCYGRTCANTAYKCGTRQEIRDCLDPSRGNSYCIGSPPVAVCTVVDAPHQVGESCVVNSDCGATTGVCDTANSSGNYVNVVGARYASRLSAGESQANIDARTQSRMRLLFANVYGSWIWQFNNASHEFEYQRNDALIATWRSNFDAMVRCGQNITYQSITRATSRGYASSESDAPFAYCGLLPEVSNLKVNTSSSTRVIIHDGEVIQLRFNTYVDPEQLPLKNIAIDWNGDSNADQVIPWGFAPRSDNSDPHAISHVYRVGMDFAGAAGQGRCFGPNEGPYANLASVQGHTYCVANPRVQIQDNWDWCNYVGTNTTLGRCRVTFPVSNADYWTSYDADVIVIR